MLERFNNIFNNLMAYHLEPIGPHWDLKFKKQQGGYRIYSNNMFKIK